MKSKLRPRCFFDIDIGHSPAGRIIFELYDDLCPKTTENFIKLCTGECGIGETTKKKLHYLNSIFHRVVKGFMIQGGDFSNFDGTGGESIYGGRFADENLETPHDRPFLLSMANCGANTNGSQFFITTKPTSHLNGKHVVFGHVVSGENLIESIENLPVNATNKPVVDATVSNCGELIPVRKKKSKKQKEKEASVDSSSSKGKKKKKSKKKKHRNKKKTKVVKEEESQEIFPKCSVRPDEIPEVPKPYFLYRGNLKDEPEKVAPKENETNDSSRYPTKDVIGRSGRVIKGRGQLRYYSKSPRDRLDTPPHWRKESHKSMNNNNSSNNNNNNNNNTNNKVDESANRYKRRKSPSVDSNKDRQRYRRSQRDRSNSRSGNTNARDNYDDMAREKRKKYDVWKDLPTDDKPRRHKVGDDLKDYGDIDMIDTKRRSMSVENNNKPNDRDNNNSHGNNYKTSKSKQVLPPEKTDRSGAFEPGTIIFPYADESDDSQKRKKWDKMGDNKVVSESKSRTAVSSGGTGGVAEPRDKNEEWPSRNEHHDSAKKQVTATTGPVTDRNPLPSRKRSSSSGTGNANVSRKSKSPVVEVIQRHTHSPPAHLIAKWQNRREKIMTRRSPVSRRSKDRTHSRPRHSPQPPPQSRKHSSRYSQSPKCDLIPTDTKVMRDIAEKPRKLSGDACKENKSSSGTMDSSPSSAGSSVVNDSTDTPQLEADKEKKPPVVGTGSRSGSTHCTSNNNSSTSNVVDKGKKENVEMKTTDDSAEKEALMVLKSADKPWLTSQWKTEEEEANKRNATSTTTNSILAKLREDDQMKKSQEKQEKQTNVSTDRKIPSPISQSISKYRSPSGTKSSEDNVRSSYSSTSSSRSRSRRRSPRRRSKTRSRSRSGYRKRYRNSRYRRTSRRSTSRSDRRGGRSRSRSYSRNSRRRYSSRSSSGSRGSRYRRSSRRNYRGLGFRRPSVSPRPRK